MVRLKSLPLNFFKFLKSLISHSLTKDSNNASARTIFLFLKSPSSLNSIER